MDPFIGEIKLVGFNFAPQGWAFCNGALLPISQYDALFALIGTYFGGDGQQTFGLPNLVGRSIYGSGTAATGTNYVHSQLGGVTEVTLTANQLPQHNHAMAVQTGYGTESSPTGKVLARSPLALGNVYAPAPNPNVVMPAGTVVNAGGNQPHSNESPILVLNYIIALEGIFPPRN